MEFSDFWKIYPKRIAKKDAERAWNKIPPLLHQDIMDAVAKHKLSERWTKDNGAYVPHAATYLNGERFYDEYEIVKTIDTTCRRIVEGKPHGTPGIVHPVHGYSCVACNRNDYAATVRQEMPAEVRAALKAQRREA